MSEKNENIKRKDYKFKKLLKVQQRSTGRGS
jgi:hypothetical protein